MRPAAISSKLPSLRSRIAASPESPQGDEAAEHGPGRRVLEIVVQCLMNLRLVSSSDDRALAIRDHLLPLVRDRGMLECQRGSVRVIGLQLGSWLFNHWTPFNDLSSAEASSPGYRHALEGQHARPDLPYGLEVWRGDKVLSVLWADSGSFEVDRFVRGSWEDEALLL